MGLMSAIGPGMTGEYVVKFITFFNNLQNEVVK